MRRILLPKIGILALWLISCLLPTQTVPSTPTATSQPTPTTIPSTGGDLALYRAAMRPGFVSDVDRFENATRYEINLQVNLDTLSFAGEERVIYTNQEDVPLDEIVFRLLPNTPGYGGRLTVDSLSVDGVQVTGETGLHDSALYVPLSTPLRPGARVDINLTFAGILPTDPITGYAQYGYIEGVLSLPDAYPLIPVYDDEGWNVELAPPYGDATFTDTALYLVRVTLPGDVTPVTSGVIVARRQNADGTLTCTCISGPMRDFELVAADLQVLSTMVGPVRVASWYPPGDRRGGELALDYAAHALRIYEDLIGPYPFNELDVVATPTRAGGIEYPGLVVIAEQLYGNEGDFFEFVVAHEVAHQWWYSLVGNDQLDEPWLDESLTQYTTLLYFERRYGRERAQEVLKESFQTPYKHLLESGQDMPVGLPVASYTEEQYGEVIYGKGPLFFHEMRQQVGDETFFAILRAYFEQYRYRVAYPRDLLAVAEEVSGQDLDALYDRWILGQK